MAFFNEVRHDVMEITNDIGTLIVQTSDVRSGRPRIAGTGVTVRRIAVWYKQGLTSEEIADRIGHLTLAQVYAGLAYYHANRESVEADLANEQEIAEQLKQEARHARS